MIPETSDRILMLLFKWTLVISRRIFRLKHIMKRRQVKCLDLKVVLRSETI